VGILLGFIGGYFAGGGGRPVSASAAPVARAGDQDRAGEIQTALLKDPENPNLLTALGNTLYDREDWDGAVKAYEKARRKAGSDPNLLSDLGSAYRNRGEFKRAIACFEKARSADLDHWQSPAESRSDQRIRRDSQVRTPLRDEGRYPEIPNLDRVEKQIASLKGQPG
jgi:tetratricopeptide (TPR) repeat protein